MNLPPDLEAYRKQAEAIMQFLAKRPRSQHEFDIFADAELNYAWSLPDGSRQLAWHHSQFPIGLLKAMMSCGLVKAYDKNKLVWYQKAKQ